MSIIISSSVSARTCPRARSPRRLRLLRGAPGGAREGPAVPPSRSRPEPGAGGCRAASSPSSSSRSAAPSSLHCASKKSVPAALSADSSPTAASSARSARPPAASIAAGQRLLAGRALWPRRGGRYGGAGTGQRGRSAPPSPLHPRGAPVPALRTTPAVPGSGPWAISSLVSFPEAEISAVRDRRAGKSLPVCCQAAAPAGSLHS